MNYILNCGSLIVGLLAVLASGCCGPLACGPLACGVGGCATGGCATGHCSTGGCATGRCGILPHGGAYLPNGGAYLPNGGAYLRTPRPGGPIEAARNLRRGLICGSGCGETYVGEWISTPPDCQDPCHDNQFVGGAVRARPFHNVPYPGQRLRNLYGKRFVDGGGHGASCGCGGASCDTCSSGEYVADGYQVDDYSEVRHSHGPVEGGCGCATCRGPESPMAARLAKMGQRREGEIITARAEQIRRR